MLISNRAIKNLILAVLMACILSLHLLRAGQLKQSVPMQAHVVGSETDGEFYLGSPGNTHYSSLTQINVSNVSKLQRVRSFDTKEKGGLETTPLTSGDVVYAYTPKQEVIALDAATGALRWTFDSQRDFPSEKVTSRAERGLAYWHNGDEKRIFAGVSSYVGAAECTWLSP